MAEGSNEQKQLEEACMLVGRFMHYFGRIERKIDQVVVKLLDLDDKITPVVTAIDFAKKLRLIKISVDTQIEDPEKNEKAHDLCSDIYKANDNRTIVAHSDFDAASGGGVQFGKSVTKDGRVLPVGPLWPANQFYACYEEMRSLEQSLDDLIRVIKPAPVEGVITWLSALSEPVPLHRPGSPDMRRVTTQVLFSPIPGSKKPDR
jgi:hypothetical protein